MMLEKKHSRTHEWIDQRSLALDKAIVRILRAQPALLQLAKENVNRWIEQRQPAVPKVLMEWHDILNQQPFEQILALLSSADEEPRRLRQSSPFCGILSEEERLAIFKKYETLRT